MVNFSDTSVAFNSKSDNELRKAKFLFRCMSNPTLVNLGVKFLTFAIRFKLPFIKSIVKDTMFRQFCGGETMQECSEVVSNLYENSKVSSILDYSVEGESSEKTFELNFKEISKIIHFSHKNPAIPFVVFKPTGFASIDLYEKVSLGKELNIDEKNCWEKTKERFDQICHLAKSKDIQIMIDAEESWMQDTVDWLTEDLMRKYNTEKCIVIGTIQMYRTGRLDFLKEQLEKAKNGNYFIGFKIVRGAYMEKERYRAKEKGYDSPIQPTKELTDKQYNESLNFAFSHRDKILIFAGTHNEYSSKALCDLMQQENLDPSDKGIWFGQLYGMSDNISFNLAASRFNVAKYLPYGPIKDVIPYLSRRASENTAVAGQTSRELSYINAEIKRRRSS